MTSCASRHGPRRRRVLGALAAVAGTVGLLGVGGCGIQASGVRVVGSAPTLQAANDVSGATAAPGGNQNQYQLYFFRNGKLTPVLRYTDQPITQNLVLTALIKGPNSTDQSQGYTSVIPTSLTVVSTTARRQQWNYQYSLPVTIAEKAEIVCTVQQDLGAPSVGTATPGEQTWNNCYDFTEDYGAPALLPSGAAAADSAAVDNGAGAGGSGTADNSTMDNGSGLPGN